MIKLSTNLPYFALKKLKNTAFKVCRMMIGIFPNFSASAENVSKDSAEIYLKNSLNKKYLKTKKNEDLAGIEKDVCDAIRICKIKLQRSAALCLM